MTTCETYHFRRVRHRRDLILRPGHFLLPLDWLYDRSGQDHDFRQWFQLGPQWERHDSGETAFASPSGERLWVSNLLDPSAQPVCRRGETEPQMSGWRSDKAESLIPTTSLHFADAGHRGAFAALFLLGRGETAAGPSRTNDSMANGYYRWTQGGAPYAVSISRAGSTTRATFQASGKSDRPRPPSS